MNRRAHQESCFGAAPSTFDQATRWRQVIHLNAVEIVHSHCVQASKHGVGVGFLRHKCEAPIGVAGYNRNLFGYSYFGRLKGACPWAPPTQKQKQKEKQ
jgi:hypothetical protein